MTRAEFLDKVAAALQSFPGSTTSWLRSPLRNAEVGGHPRSLHLCGLAIDVVLDPETSRGDFIMMCERLGLLAIYNKEKGHVHVQIPH